MKPFRFVKFGTFGLLALLPFTASANAPRAQEEVQVVSRSLETYLEALDWYGKDEALNFRFTITNPTSESIWILRWQLPSDDMDADLFQVTRNGAPVEYLGRLVKRAAPDAEDYLEIKPYSSYSVVFDPTSVYDIAEQGQYAIQFQNNHLSIRTTRPESRREMESLMLLRDREQTLANLDTHPTAIAEVQGRTSVQLWYEGQPESFAKAQPAPMVIGGYTGCTTTQQSQLKTALSNAASIATKAKNQLAANPNGSTLATYWFGTFNSTRYSTVKTHFNNLSSALSTKSFKFDCKCKDNAYAYVYASQPYNVYLCKAYWSAPAMGRDSKAGTLVHETSHFTVVAGTQDYVYGASGAHSLAVSTPSKAIMNADNHEYFAEGQP